MLAYLSKTPGIGGELKRYYEDFIVEEISLSGEVFEINKPVSKRGEPGDYLHAVIQKQGITTLEAVRRIAKSLGISKKRISYAGTKDARAVATQLISIYRVATLRDVPGVKILGYWKAANKIELGDLGGNRFTIKVRNATDCERAMSIYEELRGIVPNYFGEQRFGVRANSHLIGKHLLKGEAEEAVKRYLCDPGAEPEVNQIRSELRESWDLKKALRDFPKKFRYERALLSYLIAHKNDYVNALRRLPRKLLLLFIHAYQAYLFNRVLSDKIKERAGLEDGEYYCGKNELGFPDINVKASSGPFIAGKILGYESVPNQRERELLESEGISISDFKVRIMPELGSKGSYRLQFVELKDFELADCVFRFALPPGAYATSALREFLDKRKT